MALLLMDAAVNAFCLCLMAKRLGEALRLRRITFGALFGAAAAWMLRCTRIERPFDAAFWLPIALAMARISVGRWSFRAMVLLLAAAGLVGGTVSALAGASGSLAGGWALGAAAVSVMAANAVRAARASCDMARANVMVTIHGCSASFDGIIDSGNCLRDYLTHRPVVVLPEGVKAQLGLQNAALRPIFADTAGGRMMMECVAAEQTRILAGGHAYSVQACMAFSPGLAPGAPALIPASLINERNDRTI